jgi:hypothetical protein
VGSETHEHRPSTALWVNGGELIAGGANKRPGKSPKASMMCVARGVLGEVTVGSETVGNESSMARLLRKWRTMWSGVRALLSVVPVAPVRAPLGEGRLVTLGGYFGGPRR